MTQKTTIWVLLLLLVQCVWCNTTCPFNGQCDCTRGSGYQDFSHITCRRVSLPRLPVFPETRIEKLEITGSGIESLEDGSFGGLTAYSIVLNRNNIFFVANNTFNKMNRSLEELSMTNNRLSEIPVNAFQYLEVLKKLSLEGNQISSVIVDWKDLKNTINELKLGFNDIDSIPLNPETSLSNFKHLHNLHLSGNLLSTLEANSLPYTLKVLNASNNYIKNFPNDLLHVLHELETLDLSENNIEVLGDHQFPTKMNLDKLNLSHNKLKLFKKSFGSVIKINKLDLSLNNITEIEKEAFSGLNCKEINLSNNRLSKLDDSSFKGVEPTLERLDLSFNRFPKIPSELKGLGNLKELNFAHNHLSKVKNSLYFLGKLEKLSLSGNTIGIFPFEILAALRSISSLDLSYNKIADVRKLDFKNWGRNLEKIFLQSNSIFFLPENVFEYAPKLSELSLSFNTIGDMSINAFKNSDHIDRLHMSFSLKGYGFPNPLLSLKSLSFLALDNNNVNSIPKDITKMERLSTLILDFNRIKEIESSTFDSKAHKYLEQIRLSFNFINTIERNTFSELNNLQVISLHDNKIMKISEYSFNNLPQNLSIYLSSNKIDSIEKHAFSSLPNLKVLDLHGNSLQSFDYTIFQNVTSINEPMILNLSRNQIETLKVPDYTRAPVYIEVLDLDHNKISKIPEKLVEIQTKLKVLNLGYNEISALNSVDLLNMVDLESLSLVHNKIAKVMDDTFISLTKLQTLNMSHNLIKEIPAGFFRSLESLRILDLSLNDIQSISPTALDNTKLEFLSLSNNKITSIPTSAFLNVGKTLRILDLSHNHIKSFEHKFFSYAPKIQDLNLCYNDLSSDSLPAFRNSSSLLTLELCGNKLMNIPNDSFTDLPLLHDLNIAETGLQKFPNLSLSHLINLKISDNKITTLTDTFLSGLPKLKVLILANNNISSLTGVNWIQIPSLRTLDLSRNPIKFLDKPCFFGLYNLRALNIQRFQQLEHMDAGIFLDLDKLTSLKIDFKRRLGLNLNQTLTHLKYLRELSVNVEDSKFFEDLPIQMPWKLKSLEITGPTLSYIDPDSLKSLKAFHDFKLSITGTGITRFPKHFFSKYKAKGFKLDLSNNKLEHFGPEILYNTHGDVRRYGTKAFTGGIDIRGNNFQCGCDVKWFAEDWMRRYLVETLDVNSRPASERLAIIESLKELTCYEKKRLEQFPILTYDLTADEKLCGLIINVPKVTTKSSASTSVILKSLLALMLVFSRLAV